ncbi:GntR family transcriptional regulator [Streptomyces sp. NPDC007088]|uniref:GntR family transcriptional regulator n=1 Tax=Streptomyces sp. NPDC007088 TaxID=3364773 RepID=UPI0036CA5D6D
MRKGAGIMATPAGGAERLRYRRIAAELRQQIRAGTLLPGSRLPSVRELMAAHGVAMATVRHALQVLIAEQLIHSAQGVGTFVGSSPASSGAAGHAEVSA